MNFSPFPILATERLELRRFDEKDVNEIFFLRTDEKVNQFIQRPEVEQTKTMEDALEFIKKIQSGVAKNSFISWGICMKNQAKIVGTICLWNFSTDRKTAEVGYDLFPDQQGKGFMNESLKAFSTSDSSS